MILPNEICNKIYNYSLDLYILKTGSMNLINCNSCTDDKISFKLLLLHKTSNEVHKSSTFTELLVLAISFKNSIIKYYYHLSLYF